MQLKLPTLPVELKTKIRLVSNLLALENDPRLWVNNFHDNTVNSVNHNYVTTPELDEDIKELYGSYFNEPIVSMIGVQRNVTNKLACTPVHCDRARSVAINYYIDLGGDSVETCFYDYKRSDDSPITATNLRYNQVRRLETYEFEKDVWYAFNVQQSHSVENIETTRIFVGIILESNPDFETFLKENKEIIL